MHRNEYRHRQVALQMTSSSLVYVCELCRLCGKSGGKSRRNQKWSCGCTCDHSVNAVGDNDAHPTRAPVWSLDREDDEIDVDVDVDVDVDDGRQSLSLLSFSDDTSTDSASSAKQEQRTAKTTCVRVISSRL